MIPPQVVSHFEDLVDRHAPQDEELRDAVLGLELNHVVGVLGVKLLEHFFGVEIHVAGNLVIIANSLLFDFGSNVFFLDYSLDHVVPPVPGVFAVFW